MPRGDMRMRIQNRRGMKKYGSNLYIAIFMLILAIALLISTGCASTNHTQPKGHADKCIDMRKKPIKRRQPKQPIWNVDTRVQAIPIIILGTAMFFLAYNTSR